MTVQDVSNFRTTGLVHNSGLVHKTILAVLIGLMGGSSAVLAQQATDPSAAAPAAAPAVADVAPVPATPPAAPSAAPPSAPTEAPTAAPNDQSTPAPAADAKPEPPMDAATAKAVNKIKAKFKKKKEKLPKQTPLNIVQGTLTVDGWTGKARMNYDIADLKYVYIWAPGVGTVVISNGWFPLSTIALNAFSGNTLTVDANGHTLQVSSDKRMLGKKPASAFVYVDTVYQYPSSYPVMGYGNTVRAPYSWPGAKNAQLAKSGVVAAPPLPVDLRPTLAMPNCVAPGSKASGTPCPAAPPAHVPATAAVAATTGAKTP